MHSLTKPKTLQFLFLYFLKFLLSSISGKRIISNMCDFRYSDLQIIASYCISFTLILKNLAKYQEYRGIREGNKQKDLKIKQKSNFITHKKYL